LPQGTDEPNRRSEGDVHGDGCESQYQHSTPRREALACRAISLAIDRLLSTLLNRLLQFGLRPFERQDARLRWLGGGCIRCTFFGILAHGMDPRHFKVGDSSVTG
jgi:hypothetical protein